jgi:hypothetical protein
MFLKLYISGIRKSLGGNIRKMTVLMFFLHRLLASIVLLSRCQFDISDSIMTRSLFHQLVRFEAIPLAVLVMSVGRVRIATSVWWELETIDFPQFDEFGREVAEMETIGICENIRKR